MKLLYVIVNFVIKLLTSVVCKIDDAQLSKIPDQGPLILLGNHINFLEAPIVFPRLQPRPVTAFAKTEFWDQPLMRLLFKIWNIIPIKRGAIDRTALNAGLKALEVNKILAIFPEGTRSENGKLQEGRPGAILVAIRSKAPLMPMGFYGEEAFKQNIRKLKRTNFIIRVGNPFRIDTKGQSLSKDVRQVITREVMYQIAALLPAEYRGVYSNLSEATEDFLVFEPGVESNLKFA